MNIEKKLLQENDQKILQISFNNVEVIDFQINMINTNENRGLVQLEKYVFNNDTHLKYSVTGYESLNEYISSNELDTNTFKHILKSIAKIINESSDLLLEANNFTLDVDTVYIEPKTLEVKLINVPILETSDLNIDEKYINLLSEIIKTLLMTSKIKDGSADFILKTNKFISNNNVSINKIIEFIDEQIIEKTVQKEEKSTIQEVKKDNENKKEVINVNSNKNKEVIKIDNKPKQQVKAPAQQMPKSQVKQEPKPKAKMKTTTTKTKTKTSDIQTVEKYRYKTSNIILTIVLQPIILAVVLGMSILPGVGVVQILGGAVAMLVLDIIAIKNLLDPKKKEKVQMVIKQKGEAKSSKGSKSKSKNKEKEEKKPNNIKAKSSIKKEKENNDVTEFLDDATEFLDDETSFLGATAYVQNNNGQTIDIDSDEFVIGRQAKLQEWITAKNIGRNHAKILYMNGKYFIQDLESKNGTSLNSIRLNPNEAVELNDGDIITISELVITFRMY